MAGEAGKAFRIVVVLIAGRFDETVIFAPRDAHHAVGPEVVDDVVRIGLENFVDDIGVGEAGEHSFRFDLSARAIGEAVAEVFVPDRSSACAVDAVALSAHLGIDLAGELRWFDDGIVFLPGESATIASHHVLIDLDVILSRAMAGFAGDAEFRNL